VHFMKVASSTTTAISTVAINVEELQDICGSKTQRSGLPSLDGDVGFGASVEVPDVGEASNCDIREKRLNTLFSVSHQTLKELAGSKNIQTEFVSLERCGKGPDEGLLITNERREKLLGCVLTIKSLLKSPFWDKRPDLTVLDKFFSQYFFDSNGKDHCLNRKYQVPKSFYSLPCIDSLWTVIRDSFLSLVVFGFLIEEQEARNIALRALVELCGQTFEVAKDGTLWIKVVKFRLAASAVLARGGKDLPPKPFGLSYSKFILSDRSITNFLRLKKLSEPDTYQSIIDSMCRGVKKGSDRPDANLLDASELATFEKFTKSKNVNSIYRADGTLYFDRVLGAGEIQRTVAECVKPTRLEWDFVPSPSACIEGGREQAVGFQKIKEIVGSVSHSFEVRYQHATVFHETVVVNKEGEEKSLKMSGPFKQLIPVVTRTVPVNADLEIEDLAKLALTEQPDMRLMALAEALKCRGISKGPALESFLLKPVQDALSKQLGEFDAFKFTREKITGPALNDTSLARFIRITREIEGEDFGFLQSGDYDDATNNLSIDATRTCIEAIVHEMRLAELIGPNFARLCVRSLVGNIVVYRSRFTKEERKGDQVDGQPMGKVLSFVNLCLINFALCRFVLEKEWKTRFTADDCPVTINGDDCLLFVPNRGSYHKWEQVTSVYNLLNSVGKTFFFPHDCEMNSFSFTWKRESGFFKHSYINFGLLKGLKRSQMSNEKSVDAEDITTIGAKHYELLDGLWNHYTDLNDCFLHFCHHILHDDKVQGIPWFLPVGFGGLGLMPNPLSERLGTSNLTDRDRKIARIILQKQDKIRSITGKSRWETYALTCGVVRGFNACDPETGCPFDDMYDTCRFAMMGDQLIDFSENNGLLSRDITNVIWRNTPFDILYNDKLCYSVGSERKIMQALKHNRHVLGVAFRESFGKIEPLEWWRFKFVNRKRTVPIVYKKNRVSVPVSMETLHFPEPGPQMNFGSDGCIISNKPNWTIKEKPKKFHSSEPKYPLLGEILREGNPKDNLFDILKEALTIPDIEDVCLDDADDDNEILYRVKGETEWQSVGKHAIEVTPPICWRSSVEDCCESSEHWS